MGKRYEREERIIDNLREELRILKSENRHLRKKLKSLSKGYYKFQFQETEEEAVQEAKETAKKICWECNIGTYERIEIAGRYFRKCNNCGRRGRTKYL